MRFNWGRVAAVGVVVAALGLGATGAANATDQPGTATSSISYTSVNYPLADNSVGERQITNRSITSADMNRALVAVLLAVPANGVADTSKIKDGAVAEPDLAAAVKTKLNSTTGQVTRVEADGPYPGSTKLQDHPGNGANSTEKVPADGTSNTVWVMCADGKTALGGGYRVGADQGDAVAAKIQVTASEPTQVVKDGDTYKVVYTPIEGDAAGSIEPNGWLVEVINTGTVDATVRPWITCAQVAK